MRKSWQNLLLVVAMVAFVMTFSAVAGSAPDPEFSCFMVADDGPSDGSGGQVDGEPENLLTAVNPDDPDPDTNEVNVGPTGTEGIEAIAVQPSSGDLYAVDGGQLGTLDQDTGAFTAKASPIGTGDGAAGEVEFDNVDGLTFDPDTGTLYGSQRENGAPDLLLQIDPATGAHVSGAFGGDDYAVIDAVAGLTDIDDIAMNSSTLFGAANEGGDDGRLIAIDPANGDTADIGATGVDDIEGLGFHADGRLLGTSGKDAPLSAIYEIDTSTGVATEVAEIDNGLDYESIDCRGEAAPPPPTTQVGGTKWNDTNENGVRDEGEEGVGGVEISIFNENGSVDMETETAEDGSYVFDVPPGTYTVCEEVPAGRIQTFPTEGPSCAEQEDEDENGGEDNGGDRPREDAGTAADDDNGDNGDDNGDGRDRDDDNGDGRDRDDDDPDGRHRRSVGHTVTVAEGEQSLDNDFGNVAREICNDGRDNDGDGLVDADDPDCNISGVKWNDANGDGVRDEGEEGVGGVTILLFDDEGEVAGHTRTGRGGVYGFFRAEEGTYTVCEVLPEGREQTFPTEGPDCSGFEPERPRDAVLGEVGHEATVDEETQDRDNDFGNTGDGQPCPEDLSACNVTGLKWDDANADGVRDEGEAALGGITIHALQDGTVVEETTTKDTEEEEGNYGFLLEAGTYVICEVLPADPARTQTFPTSGADCDALETEGVDYGPFGYEVTITADEKHPDNDFGNTGDGNGLPSCSRDYDGDGEPHSSFDPDSDEGGPISNIVHQADKAIPSPIAGDQGVVTEVNCALIVTVEEILGINGATDPDD